MKLRITGTSQECATAARVLATVLEVREVSDFYPNRGTSTLGRVYLDVELVPPRTRRASAHRTDRGELQRGADS